MGAFRAEHLNGVCSRGATRAQNGLYDSFPVRCAVHTQDWVLHSANRCIRVLTSPFGPHLPERHVSA